MIRCWPDQRSVLSRAFTVANGTVSTMTTPLARQMPARAIWEPSTAGVVKESTMPKTVKPAISRRK